MTLYQIFKNCSSVTTDSRAVKGGELFFALKGENFDGNEYAQKALEAGAAYAVVSEDSSAAKIDDERIIPVHDTLVALQQLAREHRENTIVDGKRLTVVGLTGTNGKTTTKELIKAVLSVKYNVTATEGNLNNDIGVPLSLLKINSDTQIAVIEMGANHPDDIQKLVKVSCPDFGLITNVGRAHLLGFGSFEGVKAAKGALYDYVALNPKGQIFLNADDVDLSEMASERGFTSPLTYGIGAWGAIVLPSDAKHPYLRMAIPETPGSEILLGLETNLVGTYNAPNVLAAIAVGLQFGVDLPSAIDAISAYRPANKRSQMVLTENNTLVVDAYNANPTSMAAALDNFINIVSDNKLALLGDMRELGKVSLEEHIAIVGKASSLSRICFVGEEFGKALKAVYQELPGNIKWFLTSEELACFLAKENVKAATVLIKGSRGIQMEKVIPTL